MVTDSPTKAARWITAAGRYAAKTRLTLLVQVLSFGIGFVHGFSDRRSPGEVACPGLATIGMVESETERDGKLTRERCSSLASAKLTARAFARAVRGHWGIENRLHWVMAVVCRDELARRRTGHGPEHRAVVKPMALSLLHRAAPAASLKNRRKLAGWNRDCLHALLRQTA